MEIETKTVHSGYSPNPATGTDDYLPRATSSSLQSHPDTSDHRPGSGRDVLPQRLGFRLNFHDSTFHKIADTDKTDQFFIVENR